MLAVSIDKVGTKGKADLDDARRVLNELAGFNISLASVTEQLTQDGLRVFEDAAEKLLSVIARKRCALSPIDKLLKRHSGGDVHALPAAVGNPA